MIKKISKTNKSKMLILSFCILLALGLLAGCSSKDKPTTSEVTVTPSEMLNDVLKDATEINESLMDLTQMQVDEFFGIPVEAKNQNLVKISMMNVKSNEIGIFRVDDTKDIEAVKTGIKKRMDSAIAGWMEGYLPDEIEKMKNYTVEAKGNYVIYVVADEASKKIVMDKFNSYFK